MPHPGFASGQFLPRQNASKKPQLTRTWAQLFISLGLVLWSGARDWMPGSCRPDPLVLDFHRRQQHVLGSGA